MHGSNRLGGNSLSDLLVFGKRAGEHAAAYVDELGATGPKVADGRRRGRGRRRRWRPLRAGRRREPVHPAAGPAGGDGRPGRHHPARAASWRSRSSGWPSCASGWRKVGATGGRRYNPGWHLALDLRNMLVVSECTAKAALEREESRGGHTREDFPKMDPQWRQVNLVCCARRRRGARSTRKPVPTMRAELLDAVRPHRAGAST